MFTIIVQCQDPFRPKYDDELLQFKAARWSVGNSVLLASTLFIFGLQFPGLQHINITLTAFLRLPVCYLLGNMNVFSRLSTSLKFLSQIFKQFFRKHNVDHNPFRQSTMTVHHLWTVLRKLRFPTKRYREPKVLLPSLAFTFSHHLQYAPSPICSWR